MTSTFTQKKNWYCINSKFENFIVFSLVSILNMNLKGKFFSDHQIFEPQCFIFITTV